MSNSKFLEEILYECHKLGIFDQVLIEVKKLRLEPSKKYLDLSEVYEMAYHNIKKNIEKID